MKITDERERQQKSKKGTKGDASYNESVRTKSSNLDFALTIILKERKLYE